jgi:hypothetical protein
LLVAVQEVIALVAVVVQEVLERGQAQQLRLELNIQLL